MEVLTVDNVSQRAAEFLAQKIRDGTTDGRHFSVALSGGQTPWAVFGRLAEADGVPWERVQLYQVDERVAPMGHPERNLTHLQAAILSKVAAEMHPLPVDEADLRAAARSYSHQLPPTLDLIHLGLGTDGHTASLVPDDPVLQIDDRDVALTRAYQGRVRMTLTYPALNRAASIVWIVAGEDKRDALRQLILRDTRIPAARVNPDRAVVITDMSVETCSQ